MLPEDNADQPKLVTDDEAKETQEKYTIGYFKKWLKAAKKAAKDHWDDSQSAYDEAENKVAKDGDEKGSKRGYPIYKFSTQKLEPAFYSRSPKVKAQRRFGIEDDMALTMSLIADRLGQWLIDNGHFDEGMLGACSDFIHASKATTQVIYETQTEPARMPLMPQIDPATNQPTGYVDPATNQPYTGQVQSDGGGYFYMGEKAIEDTQKIYLAPIAFDEILHTPTAKTPAQITEIAYKFCLEKEEAEEKFNPDKTKQLSYKKGKDSEDDSDDAESVVETLEGWEIYCLDNKTVYWVSESYGDILKEQPDPLGISRFFPSPSFIISNKKRKSLYPTPIWVYLEATANQLHQIYERTFRLVRSIRRRCLVHGASPELLQALNRLDGEEYLAGVDISDILEKGGIKEIMQWVDVQELVAALTEMLQIEEHFKQLFFEWFNLPDILRGISDPADTAEAQGIKADSANDSFKYMKKQMVDLARDSAEIMLDVALKVFSNEKIAQIVGYDYLERGTPAQPPDQNNPQGIPGKPGHYERFPEALARLRNDKERLVKIDFETDSTSFRDEQREIQKQQMISNTVLQGLSTIGGMQHREFSGIALKLLLSVINAMGGSSQSEDMIKSAVSDVEKAMSQPPPTPPDYESMKIQLEANKAKAEQMQAQFDNQVKAKELSQEDTRIQIESFKTQTEDMINKFVATTQAEIDRASIQIEQQRVMIEQFKAVLDERDKALQEQRLELDAAIANQQTPPMPSEPQPPQIIQVNPAPIPSMPPVNVNITMPTPGRRTATITRPDGSQTSLEVNPPETPQLPIVTGGGIMPGGGDMGGMGGGM